MKKIELLDNDRTKDQTFLTLLYDERLTEEPFWIPKDAFLEAGGYNPRIKAKQQYELLLRLADRYSLYIENCPDDADFSRGYVFADKQNTGSFEDGLRTDCYIISKYKDKLLSYGCLNEVMESLLNAANEYGMQEKAAALLEELLRRKDAYFYLDDAIRPILIYLGEAICYDVLNIFARQFGDALERAGEKVEYFDLEREDITELSKYIGKHFRAIVGIQTYVFGTTLNHYKNVFLHDVMIGPIFNFTFDHPVWLKNQLQNFPPSMRILTHDENYVNFTERYYGKKTYFFPPAGLYPETKPQEKKYDISFVGSYGNYWEEVHLIHQMERKDRFLANRFLLIMRKNPYLTAEAAFERVLAFYGINYSDKEFLELFYPMRRVIFCVMHYYRCRIIKTLLESGLTLHVFGNCWKSSPFCGYSNLICHSNVTMEESMIVWQQSKLSLNVMSWHKGGFTERMANIMLGKAVLVTDDTSYLKGRLYHGKDLLIFQLDQLETLPDMLREYLNQPEKLKEIAQNGYEKMIQNHTWDERAKEFLEKILEDEGCGTK